MVVADATEVYVHDAIDTKAEKHRFEKQRQEMEKAKKAVEAKLGNKDFVNKAKAEVVTQAEERLAELTGQLDVVEKHLLELEG